ncbi:MAG: hypothetical protein Q4F79_08220 [Eubacteriales bacterium]|nr:hypothetical protein [Eubacteriales bacterium]
MLLSNVNKDMRHEAEEISIDGYAITLIFTDDIVEETYHRVKQILLSSSFENVIERIDKS